MSIIISTNGKKAVKVDKSAFDQERNIQQYIYENPESIPLYEIKEDIRLLILAREFPTNSGPIDAIGIDKEGELYIIETKLFKNPDKREVIAQSLDYGAALWKHTSDLDEFWRIIDQSTQKTFSSRATDKIKEFFGITDEEVSQVTDRVRSNLNGGLFHFVILMDELDDRLKDLILYVNQNSQFDIYAVEFEYYKHENQEIIIPRIFGTEVKKYVKTTNRGLGKLWNWDLFKQRLQEFGEEEVIAAERIIDWAGKNDIEVSWGTNQIGSFILTLYANDRKKYFCPFSVTGDAKITWNAPHQGDKSPSPFDKSENRMEILRRMKSVKGAVVDSDNVDGYNGFKLPLRSITDESARNEFFAVCLWIKERLKAVN